MKQIGKRTKMIVFGLGCFALGSLLTVSAPTYASSTLQQIKAFFNPSTTVIVNGEANHLQAINYNNTTYLPLRTTADLFGANVDYKNGVIYLKNKITASVDQGSQGTVAPPKSEQNFSGGTATNPERDSQKEFTPNLTIPTEQNVGETRLAYSEFKNAFSIGERIPGIGNDEIVTTVTYNGSLGSTDFYAWWYSMDNSTMKEYAEKLGGEIQSINPEYDISIGFMFQGQRLGYVLAYKAGFQISSFQNARPSNPIQ
ncbi:copper amine oxidase N-terminal domain-containing protein [Paenibacillus motobuensis]|uniref:copper amine oxidase N-terminal domain-containing protein n=1 Tax=Paenibacillus TaxID=44249 RepID=UPI00203CFA40|nr:MULTISPECIES: copper amine oxidase N-terminal domain-containing protein [Paenibacillus]MCM3040642.1 copper amine oxidase N-terminal domain-containing protein [Paenibacillus lutimineralis]MCM3647746.1 copper amine oxidase N-terminal domain-containing protein [Paenibacillus motobuensis]